MKKFDCIVHGKKHTSEGGWKNQGEGWYCSDSVKYPEMVPDHIKEDRKKNITDQLQSHRSGNLSREFVEAYPGQVKGMIKEGVISKQDVKKSKYVWKEIPNWNYRKRKIDADML